MYNAHRGMVPAPNSRLTELLDQLRQEFESQSRNTGEFEHQCMLSSPFRHIVSPPLCSGYSRLELLPPPPPCPIISYKQLQLISPNDCSSMVSDIR